VKYKFNKIKNKPDKRLQAGEKQHWLTGTEQSFEEVKQKYIWLNKHTSYGNSNHSLDISQLPNFLHLLKNNVDSALDIGCGDGYFCSWLYENICDEVYGLDFAIENSVDIKNIKFLKNNAHEIPLPDNSIDLITSFDFLEHIHPEYLEKTINEITRICKKYMIHKVSTSPSKNFFNDVGQLHLIQEDREWWLENVFKGISKNNIFLGSSTYLLEIL